MNSGTYSNRLFAARTSDGALFQITDQNSQYTESAPRWSGALNMIAFVVHPNGGGTEAEHELWVVAPDGSGERQIIPPDSPVLLSGLSASWSHGGNPLTGESSLVFSCRPDVIVIDVNLSAENPITGLERISIPPYELSWAEWSPDDTQLVLTRGAPGIVQIATYDLFTRASKVLRQVKSAQEWIAGPHWRVSP
jgi:Tol biopolymer transport system component